MDVNLIQLAGRIFLASDKYPEESELTGDVVELREQALALFRRLVRGGTRPPAAFRTVRNYTAALIIARACGLKEPEAIPLNRRHDNFVIGPVYGQPCIQCRLIIPEKPCWLIRGANLSGLFHAHCDPTTVIARSEQVADDEE